MAKVAIATGPGLMTGETVLLGAFTGPGMTWRARQACEERAARPLDWRGVIGGWEALTGPAGTGYAVRIMDANVAYVGDPPAPHPVLLNLER